MPGHTHVLGMQWGDEGKGKLGSLLAKEHDVGVRYSGGSNAGHTVYTDDGRCMVFHQLPLTILYGKQSVMAQGQLINFDRLVKEIAELEFIGGKVTIGNLSISDRAHITTPGHLLMDVAQEIAKQRDGKEVGTTLQGIGPTAEFKVGRIGLRVADLVSGSETDLEARLKEHIDHALERVRSLDISPSQVYDFMNKNEEKKKMTAGLQQYFDHKEFLSFSKIMKVMLQHRLAFGPFVTDTSEFIYAAHQAGRRILFEGAQGALLDPDNGTYPRVSSTTVSVGGVYSGTGVNLHIERNIGVLKAYTTRVGRGAFPTELNGELGERLQSVGKEKGATTGRARRCGWLDLVALRKAVIANGVNEFAVMKLDCLDGIDQLSVCEAYDIDGRETNRFPALETDLTKAKPLYKTFDGWKNPTTGARTFSQLPHKAQEYLMEGIQIPLKVRIRAISVGEKPEQMIYR